jgi:hypothetical protein
MYFIFVLIWIDLKCLIFDEFHSILLFSIISGHEDFVRVMNFFDFMACMAMGQKI